MLSRTAFLTDRHHISCKERAYTESAVPTRKLGLALVLALLAMALDIKAAQCEVGSTRVQQWLTVRSCDDDPVVAIQGTIVGIKANTDSSSVLCPDPDGDWNIFLDPLPDYEFILKNHDGKKNKAESSLFCGITLPDWFSDTQPIIELEVMNAPPPEGPDLSKFFGRGTVVRATGYWVEDGGHGDKTELHPLISMISQDPFTLNPACMYVAQDKSHRFVTRAWPHSESASFSLNASGYSRRIQSTIPGYTSENTGAAVEERFYLDLYKDLNDSTRSARSSANVYALSPEGHYTTHVLLKPTVEGMHPFYLGTFDTHNNVQVLAETIDYKITATTTQAPNGPVKQSKMIKATITAKLVQPPDNYGYLNMSPGSRPIMQSSWTYDESHATGGIVRQRKQFDNIVDHSVTIACLYWPDEGFNATDWELNVIGCTRPSGWSPDSGSATAGLNGIYDRAVVHDKRRYTLTPSTAKIDVQEVESGLNAPVCQTLGKMFYTSNYKLELLPDLIFGIGERDITWEVSAITTDNGSPAIRDWKPIPTSGSTANKYGVYLASVEVDAMNPHRASVSFKDTGWTSPGLNRCYANNKTTLRIRSVLRTDCGEKIISETGDLRMHSRYEPLPPLRNVVDDCIKAIAAMIWLKEHGYAPSLPPLSSKEIKEIISGNPSGLPAPGGRGHSVRRVVETKSLFDLIDAIENGDSLSLPQDKLKRDVSTLASKLPSLVFRPRATLQSRPTMQRLHPNPNSAVSLAAGLKGGRQITLHFPTWPSAGDSLDAASQIAGMLRPINAASIEKLTVVVRVNEGFDNAFNTATAKKRADSIKRSLDKLSQNMNVDVRSDVSRGATLKTRGTELDVRLDWK